MLTHTLWAPPLQPPKGRGTRTICTAQVWVPTSTSTTWQGSHRAPIVPAQLCGDSHLHPWTGRPRLQRQPFKSWHGLIYEKLLLAGANLSWPRIIGELLLGIKPESHKTWVSLQILLESTAVAMSSSLSVEDTPIPAEFWPTKWQKSEPCSHRAAIALSILFNSVHVCTSLSGCHIATCSWHLLQISVSCLSLTSISMLERKPELSIFSPSVSPHMSLIGLFRTFVSHLL